jgi:hypothetical protein
MLFEEGFWSRFDWALTGSPECVFGDNWKVVEIVQGYSGIERFEVLDSENKWKRVLAKAIPKGIQMEDKVFIMERDGNVQH